MNQVVNHNLYLVKEHTGIFKAANNYDIYDPEGRDILLTCREINLGFFTKLLRFSDAKRATPFHLEICTTKGEKIVSVKRGVAFFVSNVEVFDGKDVLIGRFKQKIFSWGGKFEIFDANENHVLTLQGKFTSWEFKIVRDSVEFATITKKWAGLAKEMFTTADNYMIQISDRVPPDSPLRLLIFASAMCIDMVLKE